MSGNLVRFGFYYLVKIKLEKGSRVLCDGGVGWVRWNEIEQRMKLYFIRYFILVFQDKVNAALTIWGQSGIRSVPPIPRVGEYGWQGKGNGGQCL